jgi:hypothetical protein
MGSISASISGFNSCVKSGSLGPTRSYSEAPLAAMFLRAATKSCRIRSESTVGSMFHGRTWKKFGSIYRNLRSSVLVCSLMLAAGETGEGGLGFDQV